jgi:Resolvase, N terminal domain
MAVNERTALRCARKSSEHGLEQDFNSLDAQCEAAEAYIKSQAHEGWRLVKTCYDDGGISGGTLERPALQALLTDIQSRRVDVVVVYKVDRLTRSLADFAKLVELFEAHGVSFVAVTSNSPVDAAPGRIEQRKPSTRLLTLAGGVTVYLADIDRAACAAGGTVHVEPRHALDDRGVDRRRPQRTIAGDERRIPTLDIDQGFLTSCPLGRRLRMTSAALGVLRVKFRSGMRGGYASKVGRQRGGATVFSVGCYPRRYPNGDRHPRYFDKSLT